MAIINQKTIEGERYYEKMIQIFRTKQAEDQYFEDLQTNPAKQDYLARLLELIIKHDSHDSLNNQRLFTLRYYKFMGDEEYNKAYHYLKEEYDPWFKLAMIRYTFWWQVDVLKFGFAFMDKLSKNAEERDRKKE